MTPTRLSEQATLLVSPGIKRPAETAGTAGAIAALIARIAGVSDADTITYIAAGVGLVPAAVTFVVSHGGLRGVARLVWGGRSK